MANKKTNKYQRKSRAREILELRIKGVTVSKISEELGVSIPLVYKEIKKALEMTQWEIEEKVIELREIILERNDNLVESLLPSALGGDEKVVDRIIKIQDQSLDILGAKINRLDITTGGKGFSAPMVVLPSIVEDEKKEEDGEEDMETS